MEHREVAWSLEELQDPFCCSLLQSVAVCCSHRNTRLFDANMSLFPRKYTTRSYVSYLIFFQEKHMYHIPSHMYHILFHSRKHTTLVLKSEKSRKATTPPDL